MTQGEDPWPIPTLLDRLDAGRLRYDPGQGWAYSNIGYLHVRQYIESLAGDGLDEALRSLVLKPLGIETARVALKPDDLAGVEMGVARAYHPGWVYHGLLVGSVHDAALLLDRLAAGALLPPDLQHSMFTPFILPGPFQGRLWNVPGYGLGTMCGEMASHLHVCGHTGGGPGSSIAVYSSRGGKSRRTAAVFATSEDSADREESAFGLLAKDQRSGAENARAPSSF